MNASQLRSLARLNRLLDLDQRRQHGATITNYQLKTFDDGSLWVSFQVELRGLPENNMLRVVDHQWWGFTIGTRGRVEAVIYPNQYKQFKGKRAFNVTFK